MSILPIAIVAVLSAWIAIHESIRAAFGGPAAVRAAAPFAVPASAEPTRLKPTTSAPPPLRNVLRDELRAVDQLVELAVVEEVDGRCR